MFTHTHGPDGHEHVTCVRCGRGKAFPRGDTKGIHAWTTTHACERPRRAAAA